jgi:SAM-dependent methyltransferase
MDSHPGIYERAKRLVLGSPRPVHWCRAVMDEETARLVRELGPARLDALEVSGGKWREFGFKSYRDAHYPEFDISDPPLDRTFDLVIIEQVLEHVLTPYRAVRALFGLLKPGGYCLVTTPFLIRLHEGPDDCSRWTETGLKYLLAEGGFPLDRIRTGSWGNRACVIANLYRFMAFRPRFHSLKNEPGFPLVVWALAQKP